jgi:hypothetical protein
MLGVTLGSWDLASGERQRYCLTFWQEMLNNLSSVFLFLHVWLGVIIEPIYRIVINRTYKYLERLACNEHSSKFKYYYSWTWKYFMLILTIFKDFQIMYMYFKKRCLKLSSFFILLFLLRTFCSLCSPMNCEQRLLYCRNEGNFPSAFWRLADDRPLKWVKRLTNLWVHKREKVTAWRKTTGVWLPISLTRL